MESSKTTSAPVPVEASVDTPASEVESTGSTSDPTPSVSTQSPSASTSAPAPSSTGDGRKVITRERKYLDSRLSRLLPAPEQAMDKVLTLIYRYIIKNSEVSPSKDGTLLLPATILDDYLFELLRQTTLQTDKHVITIRHSPADVTRQGSLVVVSRRTDLPPADSKPRSVEEEEETDKKSKSKSDLPPMAGLLKRMLEASLGTNVEVFPLDLCVCGQCDKSSSESSATKSDPPSAPQTPASKSSDTTQTPASKPQSAPSSWTAKSSAQVSESESAGTTDDSERVFVRHIKMPDGKSTLTLTYQTV